MNEDEFDPNYDSRQLSAVDRYASEQMMMSQGLGRRQVNPATSFLAGNHMVTGADWESNSNLNNLFQVNQSALNQSQMSMDGPPDQSGRAPRPD